MLFDRIDLCWINVAVAGILLGQTMVHIIHRFEISEPRPSMVATLIYTTCGLGFVMPLVRFMDGMREILLLAHSVMSILSGWSPLTVPLTVDWIIGERLVPAKVESCGGILVVVTLFGLSFLVESGMSFEKSRNLTTKASSLVLLVHSLMRLIMMYEKSNAPKIDFIDASCNTNSNPVLSIVTEEVCVVEPPPIRELVETPIPKRAATLSPRAETTPETATSDGGETEGDQWYYLDLRGFVQGPYSSDVMRSWYMSGFLMNDLLVSNNVEDRSSFRTIEYLKSHRTATAIPFFV
jgi:hypothetical protein